MIGCPPAPQNGYPMVPCNELPRMSQTNKPKNLKTQPFFLQLKIIQLKLFLSTNMCHNNLCPRRSKGFQSQNDHCYLLAVVGDTGIVVLQGPVESREDSFDI